MRCERRFHGPGASEEFVSERVVLRHGRILPPREPVV